MYNVYIKHADDVRERVYMCKGKKWKIETINVYYITWANDEIKHTSNKYTSKLPKIITKKSTN